MDVDLGSISEQMLHFSLTLEIPIGCFNLWNGHSKTALKIALGRLEFDRTFLLNLPQLDSSSI